MPTRPTKTRILAIKAMIVTNPTRAKKAEWKKKGTTGAKLSGNVARKRNASSVEKFGGRGNV